MQQRVCEEVEGAPRTLSCVFGLSETATGAKMSGQIVAYLQTGQVFFKSPAPQQTRCAPKQIRQWGLDLDPNEAAMLYRAAPVVRPKDYPSSVQLLQFFADQLGLMANQILMQQSDAEPPQITRARQFIEANSQDKLSLSAMARQVGMRQFYSDPPVRKHSWLRMMARL